MRRYAMTLCRIFTIAFAAVSLHAQCLQTKPAIAKGPITPDGPWIAYQCPEACPSPHSPPVYTHRTEDPWLLDRIWVWCEATPGNPAHSAAIPATSSCWNCLGGCAGSSCPPGELCVPRPNSGGSDCQRYACDDPTNYDLVENWTTGIPECRRKTSSPCPPPPCTPATVTLDGPTKIQPGGTCTWTATISSGCSGSSYTYHWYVGTQWVGTGPSYTGGKLSGIQNGYPWYLRVDAIYNGTIAASREIQVSESTRAMACFN